MNKSLERKTDQNTRRDRPPVEAYDPFKEAFRYESWTEVVDVTFEAEIVNDDF